MPFSWDDYPYTNFHELNLDWFIKKFKEIFDEWSDLYTTLQNWKESTTAELEEWKTGVETDMSEWEDALTAALDEWKETTEEDISDWETGVLSDLNDWKDTFETLFDTTFSNLTDIKTDAEAARDRAEAAENGAVIAQLAAEEAINGFYLAPRTFATDDGKIVLYNGGLDPTTGSNTTNTAKRRSDYIVCNRPSFRIKVHSNYLAAPFFYNKSGDTYTYLGYIAYKDSDSVFSTEYNYNQIRIEFKRRDGSTLTDSDTLAIKNSFNMLFNTDESLTIEYASADAKATGNAVDSVREMLLDDYNIERVFNTSDGKIVLYNGGLNLDTGSSESSDYKIRSDNALISRKKFYFIVNNDYLTDILYYERIGSTTTYKGYIQSVESNTLIKSDYVYDRIRFVFYRKDGAVVTDSDKTAIKNSFKMMFNTDESLLIPGAFADAYATGKAINKFSGLKYAALGDSITYGFIPRNYSGYPGQLNSYAKLTADKLNMTFANYGINGSTVAYSANSPMSRRYTDLPNDADLISVMGGSNDIRQNITLGTMADRTDSTFYGALHVVLGGLYKKYFIDQGTSTGKNKHIIVLTPIKLLASSGGISGGTGILTDMTNWINAIKEVAAYYSMPCLDFYNISGINPHLNETIHGTETGYTDYYNPYITDGIHPTQEGAEIMSDILCGFIKTLK